MALEEDGELLEFSVEQTGVRGIVGNIYKGKVENVLSGMKAAFVNIGLERNGFLYVGDSLVDKTRLHSVMPKNQKNLSAGDVVMCQVIKDQFGNKGARLSTDITLAGNYLVLLADSNFLGVSRKIENEKRREYLEQLVKSVCPEGCGFIIRSAAATADDEEIKRDAESLLELWEKVKRDYVKTEEKSIVFEEVTLFERAIRDTVSEGVDRIVVNNREIADKLRKTVDTAVEFYGGGRNIMAHFGVSQAINSLSEKKCVTSNGAYIVIDRTEALTVIDVNTGKFVGESDLEDTVFKANISAARCIAKQLRLRNISGIVVIDFIDMQQDRHRQLVLEELKNALKKDRIKTSTVGMTALGLVELTRKRARLPIDHFMLQPCKVGVGGTEISDAQLAFMLRDDLIDFMLANPVKKVYIGVYEPLKDLIIESNILGDRLSGSWKDSEVYIYADENVPRDRFRIGSRAPETECVKLEDTRPSL